MKRIHVICEGQTEEAFVKEVLGKALETSGLYISPALIGPPGHKGGNVRIERLLKDTKNLLRDKTAYCTTFFDFYGLPEKFPGKREAMTKNGASEKSKCLLNILERELLGHLGSELMRRFIPYVQMHEFEGLLFSSPEKFAQGIDKPALAAKFQKIRGDFPSPEEINNSPNTAPSKLILRHYSGYQKPLHGSLAAIEIGLPTIRQECPLFDAWLKKLEALPPIEPKGTE